MKESFRQTLLQPAVDLIPVRTMTLLSDTITPETSIAVNLKERWAALEL